jgi:excisionase family DNA binding protein
MAHRESVERTFGEAPGSAGLAAAPDFLTVRELQQILRIGRNQAYALVSSGRISAHRLGGSYRIPRTAIDRLLKQEAAAGD